ncbi:hypothetical protein Droror1_Dr00020625 [Drosera rotundifolia]
MKFDSHLHLTPLFLVLFTILFSLSTAHSSCDEYEDNMAGAPLAGGIRDLPTGAENGVEVVSLARFAVDEHNKKQNKVLEFSRVVKAREQVVAGMLHHLTVEAIDGGMKKLYEAKILVQPWLNVQKLTEFTHAGDSPYITPSDLGADRDGHVRGWKVVPVDDPEVLNAAHHAVKSIQQRSNSLLPYKLHEISHAKAEVVDDTANFNLALKVKRGNNEEKFNVEVHKNNEGNFILNEIGGN